ncbi:hypothetical protein SAMN02910317_01855 [Ruminococcaceae bacterium FB2012]|nr:hypothetical protein SAMN02910317_01855 [Ruminococcaceae bacterium FB2012]
MNKKLLVMLIAAVSAASAFALPAAAEEHETEVIPVVVEQKQSLEGAKITLRYASYTYKGVPVTPDVRNGADEVTVKLDGKKLTKGTDYILKYENNDRAGIATLTAEGIGDYEGSVSRTFVVKPSTIAITTLETGKGNIVVNWNSDPTAEGYQILYSKDRDFKDEHSTTVWASSGRNYVNLKNIPEPGEKYYIKMRAFVTKDGVRYGNYSSLRSKTVKGGIGKITVPTLNYVYRARDLKPTVTVRDTDGRKLTLNKDYTYTIANCCNVGTATITVTGKGLYTGTGTKKFNVVPADVSKASLSQLEDVYAYTGKAVQPVPMLKYKTDILVKGKDFTLSYKNNIAKGNATVTVTGKGNYTGSFSRNFKIAGAGMVTKDGATYYFDKNGVMQKGWQQINGDYYCFDRISGKLVTSTTINKIKVDGSGKAVSLTSYGKSRIETMMRAHQIMLDVTDPSDSMETKRYKCFVWEYSKHPYYRWRLLSNLYPYSDEWDVDFANDIFERGRGCCISDACAAAFLFLEIGYTDIYVCHDTGHGWCTVNERLYDPLFAEAKNFDLNYNADFTDYRRNPVGRIRID